MNAMPAARDTAVGAPFARGAFAPVFSTLMMRPHLRSFMPGHTSRASRIAANNFSSRSSCQISSVISVDGIAIDWPALLIRISTLPNALITPSYVFWISSAFDTSQTKVATRPPCAAAVTVCFACSNTSGRRARMATSAPDAANSFAMARPSPMLAPVMIALRPSRRTSIPTSP